MVSGVSQRRTALLLKLNKKTVAKKQKFVAQNANRFNKRDFDNIKSISSLQFDDLETFEHTKCKPLSVTMAVDPETSWIYGFTVSQMPAKGLIAKISRKKYGTRADERRFQREELFKSLGPKMDMGAEIWSDQNPHYPSTINKYCPHAILKTTPGLRGCIAGQGELKKTNYDPLFTLNHTFAMLRANINRLFRKTWCTTKDPDRLKDHIEVYVRYHNQVLIKNRKQRKAT
jgi:hypothetical protein